MNNFEHIKAMNIEQMAKFMADCRWSSCFKCALPINGNCHVAYCEKGFKLWLQQEAEEK